jgi:succinate dehydrogenase / fumarate reductase cytochrome b subunit
MSDQDIKSKRPLSPHLQVYKPQMTSMMSILHRASGVFLALFAILLLLGFTLSVMMGEQSYAVFTGLLGSFIGRGILFALSVCIFYHMFNGIRHLFWDSGKLFKIENAQYAGAFVLLGTGAATLAYWYCAYHYALK